MDTLMYYICYPLGYLMKWCWELLGNYGLAVILFTLLTKIVILPVSVWIHKNSIKMVKIQPEINFLHAKYYGDSGRIAEEQAKLYKREKYNPFASVVPLLIQIVLLMGVVYIIKEPLTHILHLGGEVCGSLAAALGVDASADQLAIVEAVRNGSLTSEMLSGAAADAVPLIKTLKLDFLGFGLNVVPSESLGKYIFVPLIAGGSAALLCWAQNAVNVLQAEQSKLNRYGMSALSIGISLSLGFFVYTGVALYWVFSNLFAIAQQYLLNAVIDPKKQVDHNELERSREELRKIESLGGSAKDEKSKLDTKREKADYRRFFGIVNKHLVIYSERSGFYKYYEAIINGLLSRSNMVIHYVSSDPDDAVFALAEKEPRIKAYYIGLKKLIPLMMKMDADIVLMTTPDLETYYIKRSLVRRDVEYIFVPHDMMSVHMGFRKGALDHFDTIFCTGAHVKAEVRAAEALYGLPEKTLVEFGYPLADRLIASYRALDGERASDKKEILIAPSWQEDNLLDSCVDSLISQFEEAGAHVTVRPHPEYVKRYPERIKLLTEKYSSHPADKLTFELDFSTNRSTYSSDLLVTDWSGIAYEFCFATKKPVLFINTKMKMENPEWEKLGIIPTEISLRKKVGVCLEKNELDRAGETARNLIAHSGEYKEKITEALESQLYGIGSDGAVGVTYILGEIRKKQIEKNEKKD